MSQSQKGLGSLLQITRELRKIYPEMPLNILEVLLLVAEGSEKGSEVTANWIKQRIDNLSDAAISRNIAILSDRKLNVSSAGPFNLIEQRMHPTDTRKKILTMTAKGKELVAQITGYM